MGSSTLGQQGVQAAVTTDMLPALLAASASAALWPILHAWNAYIHLISCGAGQQVLTGSLSDRSLFACNAVLLAMRSVFACTCFQLYI